MDVPNRNVEHSLESLIRGIPRTPDLKIQRSLPGHVLASTSGGTEVCCARSVFPRQCENGAFDTEPVSVIVLQAFSLFIIATEPCSLLSVYYILY